MTRNADQAKANQEVQTKASKVFALLNDRNIAEKDVIAGDLKSEAEYQGDENDPRKRGKLIGYKVTRSFTVKVRDVTALPKLVNDVLAVGGAEFSGIDAGLSKEKAMQDEVWEKAMTDARDRAEKTLKAIGMKVDSVFAVSPVAFPEIQRDIFGAGGEGVQAAYEAAAKPDPSHGPARACDNQPERPRHLFNLTCEIGRFSELWLVFYFLISTSFTSLNGLAY